MMTSLSIQLENDSKALEKKMKRRQFIQKLIVAGIGGLLLVFLFYYLFMWSHSEYE